MDSSLRNPPDKALKTRGKLALAYLGEDDLRNTSSSPPLINTVRRAYGCIRWEMFLQ